MVANEVYKILKRKESLLMFLMILIPVLYGFGFASGSPNFTYNGDDRIACLDWLQIMCNMSYQVAVFHIFISIVSVRSLGSEIEDGSIQLYLFRVNNRPGIYLSKLAGVLIFCAITFAVFLVTSIIIYYLVMIRVRDVASGQFFSNRTTDVLLVCINTFMSYLLVTGLSIFLSVVWKPLIAVAASSLIHIISLFACQMSVICYLIPVFYSNRLQDLMAGEMDAGAARLPFFSDSLPVIFFVGIVLSLGYLAAATTAGVRRFTGRDLG